jgi:glucoamylase
MRAKSGFYGVRLYLFRCLPLSALGLFFSLSASAGDPRDLTQLSFQAWLPVQARISHDRLLEAISPSDSLPGVVIASPSRHQPDYYFHWVRDAALVMYQVVGLWEKATGQDKERLETMLWDYVYFSRRNQLTDNPSGSQSNQFSGYGEPKFYVNGAVFWDDWGRPQNDGPALRSLTLIRFANALLKVGRQYDVVTKLYKNDSYNSVIKGDLEFCSHHWNETGFDLWEETRGHHFYTALVQRRALIEGAKLAGALGDPGAANWYVQKANEMKTLINRFWDPSRNFLVATVDRDGGAFHKTSNLDAAFVLAVLHADGDDHFYAPDSDRVVASVSLLEKTFESLYEINKKDTDTEGQPMGPAIGRYPEDVYDGVGKSRGHAWALIIATMAEWNYRMANELMSRDVILTQTKFDYLKSLMGRVPADFKLKQKLMRGSYQQQEAVSALMQRGDQYLRRLHWHADADGNLSEQVDRDSGFMRGARNLTWSHASFVSAMRERQNVIQKKASLKRMNQTIQK